MNEDSKIPHPYDWILLLALKDICRRLRIGLADWELDSRLREAIQKHPDFESAREDAAVFDVFIDCARTLGGEIDPQLAIFEGLAG